MWIDFGIARGTDQLEVLERGQILRSKFLIVYAREHNKIWRDALSETLRLKNPIGNNFGTGRSLNEMKLEREKGEKNGGWVNIVSLEIIQTYEC